MATVQWLLLVCFTVVCAKKEDSNYTVHRFIRDIQKEEDFQHLLILKNSNEPFNEKFGEHFVKDLSSTVRIPVIIFSESTSFFLKRKFSSKLLTVVYLEQATGMSILRRMIENLRQMTVSKVIFLLNYSSKDTSALEELFIFCRMNSVINVLAVFEDFSTTKTFYRYTHMPTFKIEANRAADEPPVDGYYPDRTKNLNGHPIRIVYGGSEPKIIFSKKKNGELLITGYAAHLFEALAKKHNTSLLSPNMTQLFSSQELIYMVRNRTVDLSAAFTYPEIPMNGYTYPYEYINWCLMLPIEPNIPGYEIFMIVFRGDTLLITIAFIVLISAVLEYTKLQSGRDTNLLAFIVNDNCLRGVLGQSFSEIRNAPLKIKFIYLQICLLGIILTTSYNSYLQTYVTSPPSQAKIRSFDDLLASGMKVYSMTAEYETLIQRDKRFSQKYYKMFVFEKDFAKYLQFRDTFNIKYAYMVNNIKWVIIREQQRIFTRPLFRQPDGVCFFELVPMVFPIDENSIYMDILNYLMLEMQSSGLLEFWQRKSFNELIEAGKLKLEDLTSKPVFVPMKADDLKLIWMGLGGAFFLTILCFLMEICVFRWKCRQRKRLTSN